MVRVKTNSDDNRWEEGRELNARTNAGHSMPVASMAGYVDSDSIAGPLAHERTAAISRRYNEHKRVTQCATRVRVRACVSIVDCFRRER